MHSKENRKRDTQMLGRVPLSSLSINRRAQELIRALYLNTRKLLGLIPSQYLFSFFHPFFRGVSYHVESNDTRSNAVASNTWDRFATALIDTFSPFIFPSRGRSSTPAKALRVAGIIILSSAIGACSHVKRTTHKAEADFQKVVTPRQDDTARLLQREIPLDDRRGDSSGGSKVEPIKEKRPVIGAFKRPFRLTFTAIEADAVLRRLSEYTSIEWIGEDTQLASAVVTLDVQINNSKDVYDLVDVLAGMIGTTVEWKGNKAIFRSDKMAGDTVTDGYLIRPENITAQIAQAISERYGVTCANQYNFTICFGENADIDRADGFLKAVNSSRGKVIWEIIDVDADVDKIIEALKLRESLVSVNVSKGRWLVAANDERYITLLKSATSSISQEACRTTYFTPRNLAPRELIAALNDMFPETCGPMSIAGEQIIWNASESRAHGMKAVALQLDKARPLARVIILILTDSDIRKLGLSVDWDGNIPSKSGFNSIELIGALTQGQGWRSIEITTDGISSSSIQQTDRVQGNVLVTDGGSQVSGIDNRTVGLTVDLDGVVTRTGYRGRIEVVDSTLSGEVTLSAQCGSYLTVDLGTVARVCEYKRDHDGRAVKILSAEKDSAKEQFTVFAMLKSHEIAALDSFRIISGESLK